MKKIRRWCRRSRYPEGMEREPVETELPVYSEDGVDLTLIRWMLSLTPAERLQALEDFANSILMMREHASKT